jgi:hypothetical protein
VHNALGLVSAAEINGMHGTGVLLERIAAKEHSVLHVRCLDKYGAEDGNRRRLLIPDGLNPRRVLPGLIGGSTLSRLLVVPYCGADTANALALQEASAAPMCVWVMDHNLGNRTSEIALKQMRNLLNRSRLCFGISPELCEYFGSLFSKRFYTLPPTVGAGMIGRSPSPDFDDNLHSKTCAMVGNIWATSAFPHLLRIFQESDWKVDWFGRGSACGWLETTPEELRAHGIQEQGFVAEDELAGRLAAYPFVIVPTGTGDESDDRKQITMLSLPTRLPYLLAAAQIPILVVGSAESCSARFVRRFGVGLSCPYEAGALRAALAKMGEAEFNAECRRNAAAVAPQFSDEGLAEWIWKSCEKGSPMDDRFERLFREECGSFAPLVDACSMVGVQSEEVICNIKS